MRFLLMGLAGGVLGGMGLGGGSLLIPLLTLFGGMGQREAQCVNLLAFLPSAAAALFVHHKKGRVRWKKAGRLLLFGVPGAAAGFFLAGAVEEALLRKGFGLFLIALGAWQLFFQKKNALGGNKGAPRA